MMKEYALGLLLLMGSVPCFAGLKEGNDAFDRKDYTTALKEFMPLAEEGSAKAQSKLGEIYEDETDKGVNEDKALYWYKKAALQGEDYAQFRLADLISHERNANTFKEIMLLAEQGNVQAQYTIAETLYNNKKNDAQAVIWFRKSAEQGNTEAQHMLGIMYETGQGELEKNLDEATSWYMKSALQGTSDAGNMGCTGLGGLLRQMIEQNINQDKDWFLSIIGQKCLAQEYSLENDAESFKWYLKAAKQGDAMSQWWVGMMYVQGKGVNQNYSQALIWFLKAAEQGHIPSQISVGEMYAEGKGTAKDYAKALEWYRQAAENGSARAKSAIAEMYEKGEGVPQNHLMAFDLYHQAAEQGNITAQFTLGLKYKKGENVPQNYTQAADWYRKAATQGDSDSQNNLGVMYNNGEGVTKNLVLAHMLYNLAAINGDETAKDNRDRVTPQLTTTQLNEAQELASKWVKGQPLPTVTKTYPSSSKKKK